MDIKFSTQLTPKPVRLASSIKELADKVSLPPLDQKTNIRMYIHSSATVLQQGRIYLAEGDLENAYIMLMKYASLIIEVLPKHKGWSTASDVDKKQLRRKLGEMLPELEGVKKKLSQMYEEEEKARQAERKLQEENFIRQQQELQMQRQREQEAEALKNQQFNTIQSSLVQQQEQELKLFPSLGQTDQEFQPSYTMPPDLPQPNAPSAPMVDIKLEQTTPSNNPLMEDNQSQIQQVTDKLVDLNFGNATPQSTSSPPAYGNQYPFVQPSAPHVNPPLAVAPPTYNAVPQAPMGPAPMYHMATAPPPFMFVGPTAPAMPGSFAPLYQTPSAPALPPHTLPHTQPPPTVASQKPQNPSVTSTTSPSSNIRKLIMDGEMFTAFMEIAKGNTSRKIETCGILAGTLKQGNFIVTTVIIPKQEGTTDTCSMTHEDEVFNYQESSDLMTLGWIHTHPTQDCFLSSVDIHTHSSYQLMLKEAVAVVIAPQHTPNFGIFSLTDIGMSVVQACDKRGFHPHEKGLYTNCAHVELKWGQPQFKVVDLRNRK